MEHWNCKMNSNVFTIEMPDKRPLERFPNQFIWSLNTCLKRHLSLFEYYYKTNKTPSEWVISLFGTLSFHKKVGFQPLDKALIKNSFQCSESYLKELYQKEHEPDLNYQSFKEIMEVETISEIWYCGLSNITSFKKDIVKSIEKNKIRNFCSLTKLLDQIAGVNIFIADHNYMKITVNDFYLKKEIISIISQYPVTWIE